MSTKKRIQIPRDLKPGDIIVDNHRGTHVFSGYDTDGVADTADGANFCPDGYRWITGLGYAVKIIRAKAAKPQAKKPKTAKVCPIPKDARKGDTVVLRNSHRRVVARIDDVGVCLTGFYPSFLPLSGKSALESGWDCVKFIRAQPVVETPKPKKPKPDPDVEYLRRVVADPATTKRLRKIAKRLESLG